MNILVVSYLPVWPLSGGSSLRVYRYIKEFIKQGHNVSMICPLSVSIDEVRKNVGNFKLYPFKLFTVSRLANLREIRYTLFSLLIIPKVFSVAKKDEINVIISHNAVCSLDAILLNKLKKVPYYLDIVDYMTGYMAHNSIVQRAISSMLFYVEWQLVKRADKIIVINNIFSNRLVELGIKKNRVVVIPDGVDLKFLDSRKFNGRNLRKRYKADKIVLYMGMIDPHQGVDILIKSVPRVLEKLPRTKFLILGTGSALDDLKRLVKERDLENSVIFTGWVDRNDLPEYIAASDLGVVAHPKGFSNETFFPIKLLEYWAMGKPVVASDLPQIRAVVSKNTGCLFEPSNHIDLADKILNTLNSRNLKKMGKNCREFVERYYDWDKLAEQFVKETTGIHK